MDFMDVYSGFPTEFRWLVVIVLGLLFGSFLTAIIKRELAGISWIFSKEEGRKPARSCCFKCGHQLSFFDLIPLFSWFFSVGKCRYCKAKIGSFYPLIELSCVIIFSVSYFLFGWNIDFLVVSFVSVFLLGLAYIDVKEFILPDRMVISVGLIALVHHGIEYLNSFDGRAILEFIFASVIYPAIIYAVGVIISKLKKQDALGLGDVKLFGVAGLWLGLSPLPVFFALCGLIGLLWGLLWRLMGKGDVFPFGPAIIISLYTGILVQYSPSFEFLRGQIQFIL